VILGAHIGIAEGLAEAPRQGHAIGCEAIQIFSKSPHLWKGPPVAATAASEFRAAVGTEGLRATAVHHGYLINLASPKAFMLRRSRTAFLDELERAELVGVDGLVFHPGAHLGSGVDTGLGVIAESVRRTLAAVPEGKVRLLLENAAGQGTAMCSTLEELAAVLAKIDAPDRVGVTLDTCHLFASGVEFRTEESYGALTDRIDSSIGRAAVRAFHLNDAKAPLGSHLDRHENIGYGELGLDGFRRLVRDPRWEAVPGYLETPLDDKSYARYEADLRVLKALRDGTTPTLEPRPAAAAAPPKESGSGSPTPAAQRARPKRAARR
jgi:deoxyribonuclease IV